MAEVVRTMSEVATGISGVKVYANAVALDADDSTSPLSLPHYSDKSVQVTGVFNGATVTLQGSNDVDPATVLWDTLHSPDMVALTFAASGMKQILENPLQIRALVSAGGGSTALNVRLITSTTRR